MGTNPADFDMAYGDRGKGPPLVLLHGFPLDSLVWDGATERLQNSFRVITPDLRGFGKSIDSRPFTIESLADDLHQLLKSIAALPCVLGGLSMGGYVAQAFAQKYPADLKALVLIDTKCAADTPEGKRGREQMIELVRAKGSVAIADKMFPNMIAAASINLPAGKRLRTIMERCPPLTIEHALAAMKDREDYTAMFSRLQLPSLIIVGAEDAIASPEVARAMHRIAPKSRLSIIPGAGHMSPVEAPDAFAEVLESELRAIGVL